MQWWNNKQQRKGIAPGLIAIIGGLLSAGGSIYASSRSARSAKEQMAFQERMSSTAAQRSVEDYRRAGLNPALAYERTASSPGGGATTFEDPISKGISTAQGTAQFLAQMKQAVTTQRLTEHQIAATDAANARDTASSHLMQSQATSDAINRGFTVARQPHDLRRAAADALLVEQQNRLTTSQARTSEYGQAGAANQEEFEKQLGKLSRAGGLVGGGARTAAELFRMLSPAVRRW